MPCVVGARSATTTLQEGCLVTVDGGAGTVFDGDRATRWATVTAEPARAGRGA